MKVYYMPFIGILESANFDLLNGRSFLLNRELDGEKMVVVCDVDFILRFNRLEIQDLYRWNLLQLVFTKHIL
jgi:hypothetical protein